MITSEQIVQAFKELLPYLETTDARAEALMELMTRPTPISQALVDDTIRTVAARKRSKWEGARIKIEDALKEKPEF